MDWNSAAEIRKATQGYRKKIWALTSGSHTISDQQKATARDLPVKGPLWVSKFTIATPEEDEALSLLIRTIDDMCVGGEKYVRPTFVATDAEWTGYRAGVGNDAKEPSISEKDKYNEMMKEVSSPVVVIMNSPSAYRKTFATFAQKTKGRTFCVRQRLAPQNPFPFALADIFLGYLSLISPPPGSPHQPIQPSSIVLAGDSSGANLCIALTQLLLRIRQRTPTIRFHGKLVDLALPAGVTGVSAVFDVGNCLPSVVSNAENDYIPQFPFSIQDRQPTCELWPSNPPRGNLYCDISMLCHPLVSPSLCKDWSGSPPIWLVNGQEQVVDSVKILVQTAARQGVPVVFKEYEAMPHYFTTVFAQSPQSKKVWDEWVHVVKDLGEGKGLASRAIFVEANGLVEREGDVEAVTTLKYEEAYKIIREKVDRYWVFTGQNSNGSRL
ncbi:MAG: hypothetical protein M1820_000947 [Bogoriella megaspora]|nr:MAG: hypothetical protein M1820_000947 [Bogoriella megaspora]